MDYKLPPIDPDDLGSIEFPAYDTDTGKPVAYGPSLMKVLFTVLAIEDAMTEYHREILQAWGESMGPPPRCGQ